MKPKYKPKTNDIQKAVDWYDGLDRVDKKSVDKKVVRYIAHVKGRNSTAPASKTMGIELVYKVMMKGR